MLHSSTQKLIHKLCDFTASGAIAWKEDERGRVVFETEGYLVEVEADPPGVRLLHADGSEADLAATPWPDGNGNYATHVADMARRANRIARGAEQAISKILSSLSAPPQKTAGPEPFAAALEFESPEARRQPEPEPPPASHSVAEAPPVEENASEAAVESAPVEPEAETTVEAAEEELPLEEAPLSEPVAAKTETVALVVERPAPEPQPRQPISPRSLFGGTPSFARQTIQKPAPQPEPVAKVTSTGLFITGFSATTRQTFRGEPSAARPEPAPAPVAQAPELRPEPPEPARKPQLETVSASGSDIYKPWS
jgi:hypothetical protein